MSSSVTETSGPKRFLPVAVILVGCVAIGAALIVLPGWIIDQYHRVSEYGPVARWVYLASVGVGVLMLLGSIGWVAWAVWSNTLRRDRRRRTAAKSAREMTKAEKQAAITWFHDEAVRICTKLARAAEALSNTRAWRASRRMQQRRDRSRRMRSVDSVEHLHQLLVELESRARRHEMDARSLVDFTRLVQDTF